MCGGREGAGLAVGTEQVQYFGDGWSLSRELWERWSGEPEVTWACTSAGPPARGRAGACAWLSVDI